jgi:hypothetical protein
MDEKSTKRFDRVLHFFNFCQVYHAGSVGLPTGASRPSAVTARGGTRKANYIHFVRSSREFFQSDKPETRSLGAAYDCKLTLVLEFKRRAGR